MHMTTKTIILKKLLYKQKLTNYIPYINIFIKNSINDKLNIYFSQNFCLSIWINQTLTAICLTLAQLAYVAPIGYVAQWCGTSS